MSEVEAPRRREAGGERAGATGSTARGLRTGLALALIVLATAALRVRLLDLPLERDEGGYAYSAQLLLQGVPPFHGAYDLKMPGLHALYAVFLTVFGESARGIHLGLLAINAITTIAVFLVGRSLAGRASGLVAALVYGVASVSQSVEGFAANTELLLLAPAMTGMAVLLCALERSRPALFLLGGLLLGAAFVIKHHAVFLGVAAGLTVLGEHARRRPRPAPATLVLRSALLILGFALPFVVQTALVAAAGTLDAYWFWLFELPRMYAGAVSLPEGVGFLGQRLAALGPSLGAAAGLALVGLSALAWHPPARRHATFLLPFVALSALAVCPTLLFQPHYMVLLLPALALCAGTGFAALSETALGPGRVLALLGLAAAVATPLLVERGYLFHDAPDAVLRASYGPNPFPESVPVARYIERNSSPEDTVALLGSEPQILFYARRRSASPHIYMYPLVRRHERAAALQREAIEDIERAGPRFLVVVMVAPSWTVMEGSPDLIFRWLQGYLAAHYRRVGLVEILPEGRTSMVWDEAAAARAPRTPSWIEVYRRTDG